jgi:hypothetical protein
VVSFHTLGGSEYNWESSHSRRRELPIKMLNREESWHRDCLGLGITL